MISARKVGHVKIFTSAVGKKNKICFEDNAEKVLENATIMTVLNNTFCELYFFDINDIEEHPTESLGAGEGECSIEQKEDAYVIRIKGREFVVDAHLNPKIFSAEIYKAMNSTFSVDICYVMIMMLMMKKKNLMKKQIQNQRNGNENRFNQIQCLIILSKEKKDEQIDSFFCY